MSSAFKKLCQHSSPGVVQRTPAAKQPTSTVPVTRTASRTGATAGAYAPRGGATAGAYAPRDGATAGAYAPRHHAPAAVRPAAPNTRKRGGKK